MDVHSLDIHTAHSTPPPEEGEARPRAPTQRLTVLLDPHLMRPSQTHATPPRTHSHIVRVAQWHSAHDEAPDGFSAHQGPVGEVAPTPHGPGAVPRWASYNGSSTSHRLTPQRYTSTGEGRYPDTALPCTHARALRSLYLGSGGLTSPLPVVQGILNYSHYSLTFRPVETRFRVGLARPARVG